MRVKFLDMEDEKNPLNGKWVEQTAELQAILDRMRHREPFGMKFDTEKGATLDVCLAETFGSAQYTSPDDAYLLAMKPGTIPVPLRGKVNPHTLAFQVDEEAGVESPEFLVGGTATPIPTRYILPYEVVLKIAVHFLQTGEREPTVAWELI